MAMVVQQYECTWLLWTSKSLKWEILYCVYFIAIKNQNEKANWRLTLSRNCSLPVTFTHPAGDRVWAQVRARVKFMPMVDQDMRGLGLGPWAN